MGERDTYTRRGNGAKEGRGGRKDICMNERNKSADEWNWSEERV